VNTAQAVPAPDLYLAPPARCSNRASGSLCLCDAWCTSSLTPLSCCWLFTEFTDITGLHWCGLWSCTGAP